MVTIVAVWQDLMEVDVKQVRPAFLYLEYKLYALNSLINCIRSVSIRPLWGFGGGILGKQVENKVRCYYFFFFA